MAYDPVTHAHSAPGRRMPGNKQHWYRSQQGDRWHGNRAAPGVDCNPVAKCARKERGNSSSEPAPASLVQGCHPRTPYRGKRWQGSAPGHASANQNRKRPRSVSSDWHGAPRPSFAEKMAQAHHASASAEKGKTKNHRSVATWTVVREGEAISYCARSRWRDQSRPLRGEDPLSVPPPFRGLTMDTREDHKAPGERASDERAVCVRCKAPIANTDSAGIKQECGFGGADNARNSPPLASDTSGCSKPGISSDVEAAVRTLLLQRPDLLKPGAADILSDGHPELKTSTLPCDMHAGRSQDEVPTPPRLVFPPGDAEPEPGVLTLLNVDGLVSGYVLDIDVMLGGKG
ncbi:uncharacterized protein LOC144147412 [Haemaphysalis longicornis]